LLLADIAALKAAIVVLPLPATPEIF